MRHKSNNIRSFILILVLLAGLCLCTVASATIVSTGKCGTNLSWALEGLTGTLTISGTGAMTTNPWDIYREEIKTVVIENGATNIIDNGFQDCPNLKSISIPKSVTSIGNYAFTECSSLISVTIPNGVTRIGECAFGECTSLSSVTIPGSVTSLGDGAFYGCTNLTSATVNAKVNNIPFSILFFSCPNIATINIPSDNPFYLSKDGVVFDKSGKYLIICPPGKKGAYSVPAGVTKIGTFSGCTGLTSITIPSSVKELGPAAFFSCKGLTNISIPEGVKIIPDYCFENCNNLKKITLPHSLEKIGTEAFFPCPLSQVTLYENLREIEKKSISIRCHHSCPRRQLCRPMGPG